jgi:serine/threonine protein phosphatase PrpC
MLGAEIEARPRMDEGGREREREKRRREKRERRELKRAKRARRSSDLAAEGGLALARGGALSGDAAQCDQGSSSGDERVCHASSPADVHIVYALPEPARVRVMSAHSCAQGPRPTMEDEHICDDELVAEAGSGLRVALYAVLDGHGGDRVAKIGKRVLTQAISEQLVRALGETRDDPLHFDAVDALGRRVLLEAFERAEAEVVRQARPALWIDGSTACCALLLSDTLLVANLGDSRAVLGRADGSALALSSDHKPDRPDEHVRVYAAGGLVSQFPGDCARVNGDLALSRALGDVRWKFPMQPTPMLPGRFLLRPPAAALAAARATAGESIVSATPDIESVRLRPGDDVLVVACDGLWDVMECRDAIRFVRARLARGISLEQVGSELVRVALARGSMDNVTVVVVQLGVASAADYRCASPDAVDVAVAEAAAAAAAERNGAVGEREAFGPALPTGLDPDASDSDGGGL